MVADSNSFNSIKGKINIDYPGLGGANPNAPVDSARGVSPSALRSPHARVGTACTHDRILMTLVMPPVYDRILKNRYLYTRGALPHELIVSQSSRVPT